MENKEYLALDIYSKSEVQDALTFAPRLGWNLHSIQDVFSRSDIDHFSFNPHEKRTFVTNELNGLTFDEFVHGKKPTQRDKEKTETHVTSYTKIVFERSVKSVNRESLIVENNWVNLVKLENRIYEQGISADYSSLREEKKRGSGIFVTGMIFTSFAFVIWLAYFIFLASVGTIAEENQGLLLTKLVLLFSAIGVSALALLFLLPSLFALGSGSHSIFKAEKKRNEMASDYKKVIEMKHGFEQMALHGRVPRLNRLWYKTMCHRYGFAYAKDKNLSIKKSPK